MTEKVEEKMVAILNRSAMAKHTTSRGDLLPGQSLEVPESEAKRLCGYKHIVLASSVVPSSGKAEDLKAENMLLKRKIEQLEGQVKSMETKETDLTGRLKEFLEASTKKDLEALQEKYK
jgi:hypothetical protein